MVPRSIMNRFARSACYLHELLRHAKDMHLPTKPPSQHLSVVNDSHVAANHGRMRTIACSSLRQIVRICILIRASFISRLLAICLFVMPDAAICRTANSLSLRTDCPRESPGVCGFRLV